MFENQLYYLDIIDKIFNDKTAIQPLLFLRQIIDSKTEYIMNNCWIEILKIIFFSKFIQNNLINSTKLNTKLKETNLHNFFDIIDFEDKLEILKILINSSFDLFIVKEAIKREIENLQNIKKEKILIEAE